MSAPTSTEHDLHGAPGEGEFEKDQPKNAVILTVTVAIVATIVAAIVFTWQFFNYAVRDEYARKVLQAPSPQLTELQALEKARLGRYQWVSKKDGVVRIPVDRARELVLAEWSNRSAPDVPVPPAEGAAASAAPAAPSASAAPAAPAPAGSAATGKDHH